MKGLFCCCCRWWRIIKSPLLFLYEVLNHSINLLSASTEANKLHWAYQKKKKTFSVRLYSWCAGVHKHTDEVCTNQTCTDERRTVIVSDREKKHLCAARREFSLYPSVLLSQSKGQAALKPCPNSKPLIIFDLRHGYSSTRSRMYSQKLFYYSSESSLPAESSDSVFYPAV